MGLIRLCNLYPKLAQFQKEKVWRCGKSFIPISKNCYVNQKTGKIRYKYIKNPVTGRKNRVKVPLTYKEYRKARSKALKKLGRNNYKFEGEKLSLNRTERGYINDIRNLKHKTRIKKYGIWEQRKVTSPDTTHINILKAEDKIRKQAFETAKVFDNFGNELLSVDGNEFGVNFDDKDIPKLKNKIVTHNHPEDLWFGKDRLMRKGTSFSGTDIVFAAESDVKEIRVVTPKNRISIKRPLNGWNKDRFGYDVNIRDVVNFFHRKVEQEIGEEVLDQKIFRNKKSADKALDYLRANRGDVINSKIATYMKAPYKKVPWKKVTKVLTKIAKKGK